MTTFLKAPSRLKWELPQAAAAFLFCAVLLGCFGATPLPKRTRTPQGSEMKNVDMSFIHPGQTTRDEVREQLRLIDTGYQGGHFFLGQWSSSTWGAWMVSPGACCGTEISSSRVWKTGNLLVEFDEAGIVKRAERFDDRKAPLLLAPVARSTPLQLDSPVEMSVDYWKNCSVPVSAKIVLSKDSLAFEEFGQTKKKHKFTVPANDVLKLDTPITLAGTDATFVGQRIRFALDLKKLGGPRGKDINLRLTLPQIITLMSYVSDARELRATKPERKEKVKQWKASLQIRPAW